MEIPISFGGTMRIDYEEHRIHFCPHSEDTETVGFVDESAVVSGCFERDVLALELAAELMRQWKTESNAEEASQAPMALVDGKPAARVLQQFALR